MTSNNFNTASMPEMTKAVEAAYFRWAQAGNALVLRSYINSFGQAVLDKQDENGNTALIWAVWGEHSNAVDFLLRHHANTEIKEKVGGHTALIWAARSCCAGMVEKLLAAGADTRAVNKEGKTALDYALANDQPDIAALLRKGAAVQREKAAADVAALHHGTKNDIHMQGKLSLRKPA